MNRLVIIGNGFDLAHGLPTSYGHFIDDFWLNLEKEIDTNLIIKDIIVKSEFYNLPFRYGDIQVKNYNDFKTNLSKIALDYRYVLNNKTLRCTTSDDRGKPVVIFEFRNHFFYHLCERKNIQNWVDVENEYYNILKGKAIPEKIKCDYPNSVSKLNEEFEQVKNLLENYLAQKVNVQSAFEKDISNVNEILSFFKIQFKYLNTSLSVESKEAITYSNEFNNEDLDDLESFDYKIIEASKKGSLYEDLKSGIIEQNNLFLNFNYTNTINKYAELLNEGDYCGKVEEVQIHGKIYDYKNKMNFGFGDEKDEDYKLIENINDNEYLNNFKSFGYSQNSNYRKLLDFIDDNKFQVYIMGHSCGLSDRTLLNTIFEHQNCRSIKVYFYQWEDQKSKEIKDNYTEIIQNISRHFEDKKMMRSKIVNKISCQALPQKQIGK